VFPRRSHTTTWCPRRILSASVLAQLDGWLTKEPLFRRKPGVQMPVTEAVIRRSKRFCSEYAKSLGRCTARIGNSTNNAEEKNMLWTIFVVILILWLLGFSLHVAGSLIHLLLVVALVVLVINLVSGRRVA
jgi:hypothetical protein